MQKVFGRWQRLGLCYKLRMSLADAAAPPPAPHPAAPDAPADTAPLLNSFVTPPQ